MAEPGASLVTGCCVAPAGGGGSCPLSVQWWQPPTLPPAPCSGDQAFCRLLFCSVLGSTDLFWTSVHAHGPSPHLRWPYSFPPQAMVCGGPCGMRVFMRNLPFL